MINLRKAIDLSKSICESEFKGYTPVDAHMYKNFFYINIEKPERLDVDLADEYNETIVKIDKISGKYKIIDFLDLTSEDGYFDKRIKLDITNL